MARELPKGGAELGKKVIPAVQEPGPAMRDSTDSIIRREIVALRKRADGLEGLLAVLAQSPGSEAVVWELICAARGKAGTL